MGPRPLAMAALALSAVAMASAPVRPSGNIVWDGGLEAGIFLIEHPGGRARALVPPLFRGPDVIWSAHPRLSPDGSLVAFERHFPPDPGRWKLCVVTTAKRARPRCMTSQMNTFRPSWSPDGRRIAFLAERERRHWLHTTTSDGRNRRRLTAVSAFRSDGYFFGTDGLLGRQPWSPDGRRLVFSSSGDIYVIGIEGRGLRRLTTSPAWDRHPSWSPDGTKIAWLRGGNVHVMAGDGTGKTRVTFLRSRPMGPPVWSPVSSRRAIAFRAGNGLYVTTKLFARPRRVALAPGLSDPAWSPDGRALAFIARRPVGHAAGCDAVLQLIGADGTSLSRLACLAGGTTPDWSPRSR